jgi:hypothetical protein
MGDWGEREEAACPSDDDLDSEQGMKALVRRGESEGGRPHRRTCPKNPPPRAPSGKGDGGGKSSLRKRRWWW